MANIFLTSLSYNLFDSVSWNFIYSNEKKSEIGSSSFSNVLIISGF